MKAVLVTGSKSGIGKSILGLLQEYASYEFQGDVRSRLDWERNVEIIIGLGDTPWAVINSAGIAEAKKIMDINVTGMREMFEVNCLSLFHSIQTFGKAMIDNFKEHYCAEDELRVYGHIITINSISGLTGMSGHAHYCASKFAANGLAQVAAKELSKYGIMVNSVCPGPTKTPMWDKLDKEYCAINEVNLGEMDYLQKQLIKRLGEPEDTANLVRWLISSENRFITGTNIKVCGGNLIG